MVQHCQSYRERRILEIGRDLMSRIDRNPRYRQGLMSRWLMNRLSESKSLRIQTLRFVDVLPTLRSDADVMRHLHEYFDPIQPDLPRMLVLALRFSRASEKIAAKLVRQFSTLLSTQFMGGADIDAAFHTVDKLRKNSIGYSLDLLGEAIVSESESDRYQASYLQLIDLLSMRIKDWTPLNLLDMPDGIEGPRLYISVKLTSLYSQIDPVNFCASVETIASRLRPILVSARKHNAFVCVDMEQYEYKSIVLACFKSLLMEPGLKDWSYVGLAIQAYLIDSEQDIRELIAWADKRGCPVTIRLVRGAYWDYENVVASQHDWPVPVWRQKWQTDICYEKCMDLLFSNYPAIKIAVATHNLRSLALALSLAEEKKLVPNQFEFQMLYGMADELKSRLAAMGFCIRVYVPFGDTVPGMAYLVRRLLENSSNESLFLRGSVTSRNSTVLEAPNKQTGLDVDSAFNDDTPIADATNPQEFINEPLRQFIDPNERICFAQTVDRVRNQLGREYPIVIDGKAIDSKCYINSVNPAHPEESVGRVAKADLKHAELAYAGAKRMLKDWSNTSVKQRTAILLKAAAALRKRRDEFAAWEIFEAGKCWREADANVAEAIDFLEYYAMMAQSLDVIEQVDVPGESNRLARVALGVGLIVPPWNFPLAILAGMTSAAIVMGNAVILKPSSQTPVIAYQFVKLLADSGLPDGVVQFLPGSGPCVGEYLVKHPGVHFIAFTGSEEVGNRMMRLAACKVPGQNHVKRVVAEMGGKNAIIVDSDADLDDVVSGTIHSAFGYQGQKCSACSRLIVIGDHYVSLLSRLKDAAASLQFGSPDDPRVNFGPVITAAARDRILRVISQGKTIAKLVCEIDSAGADSGYFVKPTIFSDVPRKSVLGQHEIFGPVLSVFNVKDLSSALKIANDSAYGLTGGVYSRSPKNIQRVEREFEVGNLYINRSITGALVFRQPFGGVKMSGSGSKAGGKTYLEQFCTSRVMTENTMRRGYAP